MDLSTSLWPCLLKVCIKVCYAVLQKSSKLILIVGNKSGVGVKRSCNTTVSLCRHTHVHVAWIHAHLRMTNKVAHYLFTWHCTN